MILDYEPGDKVTNPSNKDWGIGQVQTIINDKLVFTEQGYIDILLRCKQKIPNYFY